MMGTSDATCALGDLIPVACAHWGQCDYSLGWLLNRLATLVRRGVLVLPQTQQLDQRLQTRQRADAGDRVRGTDGPFVAYVNCKI